MDDFMKLEAKEIISTGVEKSIVAGAMNVEVRIKEWIAINSKTYLIRALTNNLSFISSLASL